MPYEHIESFTPTVRTFTLKASRIPPPSLFSEVVTHNLWTAPKYNDNEVTAFWL